MDKEHYRAYQREYKRRYRATHPEAVKKDAELNHNYYQRPEVKEKNKERLKEYRKTEKYKEWLLRNREKRRLEMAERRKDPLCRASFNMARNMNISLKSKGLGKKNRHWEDLVGYTLTELKNHLEALFTEGMSWGNYGKWHIDHIKPRSKFNITSLDCQEFKECWSLNNLRPLWAKDNLSKGNR